MFQIVYFRMAREDTNHGGGIADPPQHLPSQPGIYGCPSKEGNSFRGKSVVIPCPGPNKRMILFCHPERREGSKADFENSCNGPLPDSFGGPSVAVRLR
jgi:hypothetical protein